jgi:hypothetical protein
VSSFSINCFFCQRALETINNDGRNNGWNERHFDCFKCVKENQLQTVLNTFNLSTKKLTYLHIFTEDGYHTFYCFKNNLTVIKNYSKKPINSNIEFLGNLITPANIKDKLKLCLTFQ